MAKIEQPTIDDPELGEIHVDEEKPVDEIEALLAQKKQEAKQEFSDLLEKHEEVKKALGLTGVTEFQRAIDSGDKPAARAAINMIPESSPMRKAMERLLQYI